MSDEEFSLTVRLRHSFGRWQMSVGGERETEVPAKQALKFAARAGDAAAERVREIIRADADKAEQQLTNQRERSRNVVAAEACRTLDAEAKALRLRAQAEDLAAHMAEVGQ
jgi:hypothetical protein